MNPSNETVVTRYSPQGGFGRVALGVLLLAALGGLGTMAWLFERLSQWQLAWQQQMPISQTILSSELLAASWAPIGNGEAILEPALGLRNPGKVQKVERIVIRLGQTAVAALTSRGIAQGDATAVIEGMKHVFDFRRLKAADTFVARLDEQQRRYFDSEFWPHPGLTCTAVSKQRIK